MSFWNRVKARHDIKGVRILKDDDTRFSAFLFEDKGVRTTGAIRIGFLLGLIVSAVPYIYFVPGRDLSLLHYAPMPLTGLLFAGAGWLKALIWPTGEKIVMTRKAFTDRKSYDLKEMGEFRVAGGGLLFCYGRENIYVTKKKHQDFNALNALRQLLNARREKFLGTSRQVISAPDRILARSATF
ncbi:hypothetical protein [Hyphococcus sp.]|uniref:hypothetical protein n=1 Tax=Hyphococcus sp. TaxID=2038636 RepID=UPI003D0B84F2